MRRGNSTMLGRRDNNPVPGVIVRTLPLILVLIFITPALNAWEGPYAINSSAILATDKATVTLSKTRCHTLGTFIFRLNSGSNHKKVGKIAIRFFDVNGEILGAVRQEYTLQPNVSELLTKYAPCQKAQTFSIRHEPLI